MRGNPERRSGGVTRGIKATNHEVGEVEEEVFCCVEVDEAEAEDRWDLEEVRDEEDGEEGEHRGDGPAKEGCGEGDAEGDEVRDDEVEEVEAGGPAALEDAAVVEEDEDVEGLVEGGVGEEERHEAPRAREDVFRGCV